MVSNLKVDKIQSVAGVTTAMNISSDGTFIMPNRPHVFAQGFGNTINNQTINGVAQGSSWGIAVNYDSVPNNQGNHFNNSTGKFIAPVSGIYSMTVHMGYKSASNYVGLGIHTGSDDHFEYGTAQAWASNNSGNGQYDPICIALNKYVAAGKEVCVAVRHASYANPHTDNNYFTFSCTYIG